MFIYTIKDIIQAVIVVGFVLAFVVAFGVAAIADWWNRRKKR